MSAEPAAEPAAAPIEPAEPIEPAPRPIDRLRLAAMGRPMLVAIAAINAITGLFAVYVLAPLTLGSDVEIYRRGAEGIADGVIAKDFFYAPLFGVLATPLTWIPFGVATLVMSGIGLAILLAGVVLETRGQAAIDRVLIAIAAVSFMPVVYELLIGQVTMLMAAVVYPVRNRDGFVRGIPLGVVLALVPKPLLLPLLVWMLVRRRRALASSLVTAVAVTLLGVALLGTDIHTQWIAAVAGTGQIERHGNLALTALGPRELVWPLIAVASALILWAILRDERRGFVAALVGAMLVQPFTLAYAISIILLAVRPAAQVSPLATRLFSLTANIAVIVAFMAWAGAALVAITPWRRAARAERPGRDPVTAGP